MSNISTKSSFFPSDLLNLFNKFGNNKGENSSRKKFWFTLLFGLLLLVFLLLQISINDFLKIFSNLNITFFLFAILVGVGTTIIKTFRFGTFYPAPGRWLRLHGIFAFFRFIYFALPFNIGEVVYLNALKRYKFIREIFETLPTWIYIRMTDVIALSLWLILTLNVGQLKGHLFNRMFDYSWIFIIISILFISVMLSFPFWITKISLENSTSWFKKKLKGLQEGFNRTLGALVFFRTLVITLFIWSGMICWHVLAQFAFNAPIEIWEKILVSITIYIISLLPINTPLNIGTDEAAWTGALIMVGVTSANAISIALCIRLLSMIILITDGILGYYLLFIRKNSIGYLTANTQ